MDASLLFFYSYFFCGCWSSIFLVFFVHWALLCWNTWALSIQTNAIHKIMWTGGLSCDKIQAQLEMTVDEAVITHNVNELSTAHVRCLSQNYNNQTLKHVYRFSRKWINFQCLDDYYVTYQIIWHIMCWKKIN